MKIDLSWLSSAGGPLLLLPESLVAHWRGSFGASGENSQSQTDYDMACDVQGDVGVINVNAGQELVLGDEPMQASWLPLSEHWWHPHSVAMGGLTKNMLTKALTDLSRITWQSPTLTFGVSDAIPLLFDAACSGNDPGDSLHIDFWSWSSFRMVMRLKSRTGTSEELGVLRLKSPGRRRSQGASCDRHRRSDD